MFVTTGGHFRAREGPLARSAMLTGRVQQPRTRVPPDTLDPYLATWRSGYAAACKAVYTGSIPVVAFHETPANAGFSRSRPVSPGCERYRERTEGRALARPG